MGKSSTAVNHWMRDRGRFADLFNGVVFDGEQVVCPEDLYQSGVDSGMEMGIQALVETCRELGQTREVTEKKVGEKFTVSREKVRECMEKYWA